MLRSLYLIYYNIVSSTLVHAAIVFAVVVLLYLINRRLSVLIELEKNRNNNEKTVIKEGDANILELPQNPPMDER